jgi:hypothetical protein
MSDRQSESRSVKVVYKHGESRFRENVGQAKRKSPHKGILQITAEAAFTGIFTQARQNHFCKNINRRVKRSFSVGNDR